MNSKSKFPEPQTYLKNMYQFAVVIFGKILYTISLSCYIKRSEHSTCQLSRLVKVSMWQP